MNIDSQRINAAYRHREIAARIARERAEAVLGGANTIHHTNKDEALISQAGMSFTKGLDHNNNTGLVSEIKDFRDLRQAIDGGMIDPFNRINVPTSPNYERRQWEAPTAGYVYDLEGPDALTVTMPPAPAANSADGTQQELAYEMAEVYELALLRDIPFTAFQHSSGSTMLGSAISRLNGMAHRPPGTPFETNPTNSARPRFLNNQGDLDEGNVFRGSSHGCNVGPYLSQFLLMGNGDPRRSNDNLVSDVRKGYIRYGAQQIDQRVIKTEEKDYMVSWRDWLCVQKGYSTRDNSNLFESGKRLMTTPRDLATYVHDDALYQAYLNACLLLLSFGAPLDPNFSRLAGQTPPDARVTGFALFGGPHILSLVTEVATRALKAVRYQKFQNHLRARPEVLAARIAKSSEPGMDPAFATIKGMIDPVLLESIRAHNIAMGGDDLELLPMAFQEGSPMHPAYGAGHATVAGACVTMLKAFFDTDAMLLKRNNSVVFDTKMQPNDKGVAFAGAVGQNYLNHEDLNTPLTLEGELNKLAANISIGRNIGGVHYFSDYYDSARMGEEIAIGILQEQAGCYANDRFVLNLRKFDGEEIEIIPGRADLMI